MSLFAAAKAVVDATTQQADGTWVISGDGEELICALADELERQPDAGEGEECFCPEHGHWRRAEDIDPLVKRLDVALNGADGAERPLLIDVVGQVEDQRWRLVRAAPKSPPPGDGGAMVSATPDGPLVQIPAISPEESAYLDTLVGESFIFDHVDPAERIVLDIRDFGAVADGETDSTRAVQVAISTAVAIRALERIAAYGEYDTISPEQMQWRFACATSTAREALSKLRGG